ncbi:hypothetical protein COLO4_04027 [Corchorus olitorius]|uniref:Uncharacterized protein n=1 Tax=Corchorus olitorius TaxID=93759 RepID=A0A1R3KVR1_9ROSI|nr:hypothetical protein COLO4_04027 [Corchorus olitorius]
MDSKNDDTQNLEDVTSALMDGDSANSIKEKKSQ